MKTHKSRGTRVIKTILTAAKAVAVAFGGAGSDVRLGGLLSLTAGAETIASAEDKIPLKALLDDIAGEREFLANLTRTDGESRYFEYSSEYGYDGEPGADYGKYSYGFYGPLFSSYSDAPTTFDTLYASAKRLYDNSDATFDDVNTMLNGDSYSTSLGYVWYRYNGGLKNGICHREALNKHSATAGDDPNLEDTVKEADRLVKGNTNAAYPNVGSVSENSPNALSNLRKALTYATEVYDTKTAVRVDVEDAIRVLQKKIDKFKSAVVQDIGSLADPVYYDSAGEKIYNDIAKGGSFRIIGNYIVASNTEPPNVRFAPFPLEEAFTEADAAELIGGVSESDCGVYPFVLSITQISSRSKPARDIITAEPYVPVKLGFTVPSFDDDDELDSTIFVTFNIPQELKAKGFRHYEVFQYQVTSKKSLKVTKLAGGASSSNWKPLNATHSGDSVSFKSFGGGAFAIVGCGVPAPVSNSGGGGVAMAEYITSAAETASGSETAEGSALPNDLATAATAEPATAEPASTEVTTADPAEPTTADPALATPAYTQSEPPSAEPPSVSDNGGNPGDNNTAAPSHGRGRPVMYPIDTGAAVVPVGIVAATCVVTSLAALLLKRRRK